MSVEADLPVLFAADQGHSVGAGHDEDIDARDPLTQAKISWRGYSWSYQLTGTIVNQEKDIFFLEASYDWEKDTRWYINGILIKSNLEKDSATVKVNIDVTISRRILILNDTFQSIGGSGPVADHVIGLIQSKNGLTF